jgi:hypothetical protein
MPPAPMYMTIKNDRLYLQKPIDKALFPNWSVEVFVSSLGKNDYILFKAYSCSLTRPLGYTVVLKTSHTFMYPKDNIAPNKISRPLVTFR